MEVAMTTVAGGRRSDSRIDQGPSTERSLAELKPGQIGVIVGWSDSLDSCSVRRFEDLGFCPGAEISVLRRAPLGDPFVYGVAGYEIAIRREHTRHLLVSRR